MRCVTFGVALTEFYVVLIIIYTIHEDSNCLKHVLTLQVLLMHFMIFL